MATDLVPPAILIIREHHTASLKGTNHPLLHSIHNLQQTKGHSSMNSKPGSDPHDHFTDDQIIKKIIQLNKEIQKSTEKHGIDLSKIETQPTTHYLLWIFTPQKIGCPICDIWSIRDAAPNPANLALYTAISQYPPHESPSRAAWIELIAPLLLDNGM